MSTALWMYFAARTEPQVERLFDFKRIREQKWKQQQPYRAMGCFEEHQCICISVYASSWGLRWEWRLCIWITDEEGWLLVFRLRHAIGFLYHSTCEDEKHSHFDKETNWPGFAKTTRTMTLLTKRHIQMFRQTKQDVFCQKWNVLFVFERGKKDE